MKRFFLILFTVILVLSLCSCGAQPKELKEEDIKMICELGTLKCYYNNVAKISKEKDNIFQKNRKMWIEYEGEAVLGIDMSKVEIKITNETVKITMPKASILSINPRSNELTKDSYITSSDGFLIKNPITADEEKEAITLAQQQMKESINTNTTLLTRAENRAKKLIENYIQKIGEISGKTYQIEWKTITE